MYGGESRGLGDGGGEVEEERERGVERMMKSNSLEGAALPECGDRQVSCGLDAFEVAAVKTTVGVACELPLELTKKPAEQNFALS